MGRMRPVDLSHASPFVGEWANPDKTRTYTLSEVAASEKQCGAVQL